MKLDKNVSFNNLVSVILIPERLEYDKIDSDGVQIKKKVWYSMHDLNVMENSFKQDLRMLIAMHGENALDIWKENNCMIKEKYNIQGNLTIEGIATVFKI